MKLILIATVCLVLVEVSFAATGISVGPVTINNCACSAVEIKDGGTQREFRLLCSKSEGTGKKKKTTWHTSCIYGGDPHSCAKYNKAQTKFYEGLLSVMATDYCDETLKDLECKTKTTYNSNTICSEINYTFNRYK